MNTIYWKNLFHSMLFFGTTFFIHSSYSFTQPKADKYHLYFWANYNQLEDRNDMAKKCYDVLFKNHKSPHIYPGYLLHLLQTDQNEAIINLIPIIEKNDKQDLSTQLIFISAYEALGNYTKVMERLVSLTHQYPDNPQIIYQAAAVQATQNKFEEALKSIDTYLTSAPQSSKNFIFYFLKAQIFSRIGKTEEALINVNKSLELYPEFDQGWLLLGLINELAGNLTHALSHYQTCLKIVGSNPMLERQIMQLQLKVQQPLYNNHTHNFFTQALNAYNNKEYPKALQIINQSPAKESHIPSKLLKIELLCKVNKVDEAIASLTLWMINDELNDTWYRALHLLYKAGVPASIILNAFSNLEQKNAKNILPLLYKADIYLRTNEKQNALTYLTKALTQTAEPLLRTKILFQIALLQYHNQDWKNLNDVLVESKKLNQNYPPMLNLSAYYYATKGNDLKHAESLILTALKHEKNPHFLDTHALILYKQKNMMKLTKFYHR